MATFCTTAVKLQADLDNLRELLARLKEQRRQEASSASVVKTNNYAAAAAAAAASPVVETVASVTTVAIPKYAKPIFGDLNNTQQRFVRTVIKMVCNNDGINMANITNPALGGIPFPKEHFSNMKLWDTIRIYTNLVREGENIYLPSEKPVKSGKKVPILKTVAEFNNDFAKAIQAVREEEYGVGWSDEIPLDAPMDVSIEDVLNEFADLTQYAIDETDPCASLDKTRFLIVEETGMVSIIPIDA